MAIHKLFCLIAVAVGTMVFAQTHPVSQPTSQATTAPIEGATITTHSIGTFKYRAQTGMLPYVAEDNAKPTGNLFYTSYEKLPLDPSRPVTFVFNGGPGAASAWLHIGTAGPRIVELGNQLQPPASPAKLIDNPDTWLNSSDLVFIDPIGTGYSRLTEDEKKSRDVFSTEGDIKSVANFIRLFLTRNNRWLSPKFLAGESYGTTRAAGLADYLHERYGIDLRGIVLISTVLDFATLESGEGNDIPYILYLPSYTAAAHYHHKLPADLQQRELPALLAEVKHFALNDYTTALFQGGALPNDQKQNVANQLSRYTGLSVDYVLKSDLRVDPARFEKKLLNDQRLVIGRFDDRLTAFDEDPAGSHPELDPSFDFYVGLYNSAINQYLRDSLNYKTDTSYEVLTGRVHPWDFGKEQGYLNMTGRLRSAMVKNTHLRILVCSGYNDLATPFTATTYTLDRLALTPELRQRITETFWPAGHMIYHNSQSRVELNRRINSFLGSE